MAYVDGSKCSSFNVIRKRPPTLVWTSELLREREDEELNSGGFGFGEIEGPFVEQEDPMPNNIEGYFWKLNKHINSVIKEKTGFEKTLDAAEYMFLGKLEGFFERYVDDLKYKGCRKEGNGNANISDANRAADAQADGQNNKEASFVSVQAIIGERVISLRDEHADIGMDQEGTVDENILGSPTLYNMGTETQTLANELVDKLSNENRFGSPSLYNMGPETQDEVLRSVDDVDATIERRKWFDMSDIPSTAVGCLRRAEDKRPVTISKVIKSPFIGRVVDADGSLNATEKRVTKYLFEVLKDKSKESPFRMFLPTFVVNNTVYNNLLGREGRFQSFMGYVVNAIENKGKCELLKDIDVNENIVRKRVKNKIETCDNITVAAMMQEDFGQYLMLKNHSKVGNFIGSELEVGEFDWQTNSMETEAGIFVMRHMETCMGMGMDELNCCLAGN
nr:C2 calcium-dependent membrane targeting [Tanacetum cinerariifolium]